MDIGSIREYQMKEMISQASVSYAKARVVFHFYVSGSKSPCIH
ncbi:hypothetical protein SAMN06264849_10738 [Melghirimyces algeriensis]|uniref:Uncharacterized protein n=1 Tax=Melghirimyces algeriensis TaxID=910412 RepID=A0A521DWB0_9BACL|nr:hypothetical protein SAMN06264849_10738 [Melghirimyces algeriensis]